MHAGPTWPSAVGTGKPRAELFLIRAATSWHRCSRCTVPFTHSYRELFFEHLCLRLVAGSTGMSVTMSPVLKKLRVQWER